MRSLKLISFVIIALLCGCSNTSPGEYVNKAALNSNLITAYYTPKFFGEIQELKAQNRLVVFREKTPKPTTAEKYLKNYLPDLSKNISDIKTLKKTSETKEMLEASLDYFEQADKIFKNDYLRIAKMIDANKPQPEVEAETHKIFEANNDEMMKKYDRLWATAEAYAAKNNIPLLK